MLNDVRTELPYFERLLTRLEKRMQALQRVKLNGFQMVISELEVKICGQISSAFPASHQALPPGRVPHVRGFSRTWVDKMGDPDFLYAAPDMTACAAFSKESRMRCANATKPHRKSRGSPPFSFL